MSQVYSVCSHIKVYDTTVQIMFLDHSLCPKCTVYVPTVQFIIPALKFISLEYSLCPSVQFMS